MKETIKINLAQRLFDLDADAYTRLKDYLDSLKKYFDKSSIEATEILFDIEQRIAEILDEKLKDKKQVVTLGDVNLVIEMMGTAEDFARESDFSDEDSSDSENQYRASASDDYSKEHRKLYRDIDSNILGGVCSGLAAYFNVETIWIRLAMIVLFFMNGVGLILYIILWVVVPAAVTTAQKLQMKGKPVNIGNIQDSVKTEFNKVKDNFSKYRDSDSYRRSRDVAHDAANTLGAAFMVIVKVILVIIGVGFAVAGLALLLSLLAAITAGGFWNGWNIPNISFHGHLTALFHNITLFSLAVFIVIIVPIGAILTGIFRLVFNLKRQSSVLAAFGWTFWSLALVFVLITLITGVNRTTFGAHYKDVKELNIPNKKALYLRLDEDHLSHERMDYYTIFGKEIIRDRWNDNFLVEPELSIVASHDINARLEIEYSSLIPWENSRDYDWFNFTLSDSVLVIDNYWFVDEDDMWRLPKVTLKLYLPEGQIIHIDSDFRDISTSTNEYEKVPDWFYSRMLIMKDEHLSQYK